MAVLRNPRTKNCQFFCRKQKKLQSGYKRVKIGYIFLFKKNNAVFSPIYLAENLAFTAIITQFKHKITDFEKFAALANFYAAKNSVMRVTFCNFFVTDKLCNQPHFYHTLTTPQQMPPPRR